MSVTTAVTAVTVAVLGSDPVDRRGAVAWLGACPGITPVAPDDLARADVVLVIAGQVGEETLSLMRRAAAQAPGRELRFVLVCDAIGEPQLLRALGTGMVSVLPGQEAEHERLTRALVNAREGRAELPGDARGWLQSRIRVIQRDALGPHGLTSAGLFTREVDVLRLLADGYDTREVAKRLNYSERTVRNIIHGVLTRLNLRNRTHAVAYALRTGAI